MVKRENGEEIDYLGNIAIELLNLIRQRSVLLQQFLLHNSIQFNVYIIFIWICMNWTGLDRWTGPFLGRPGRVYRRYRREKNLGIRAGLGGRRWERPSRWAWRWEMTPLIRGRRHVSRGQWRWFCERHPAVRMDPTAVPPTPPPEDRNSGLTILSPAFSFPSSYCTLIISFYFIFIF